MVCRHEKAYGRGGEPVGVVLLRVDQNACYVPFLRLIGLVLPAVHVGHVPFRSMGQPRNLKSGDIWFSGMKK